MIKKALLLLCTVLPSPLRLLVWRMLGIEVGRGCHVSIGSIVLADEIALGHGATIDTLTMIYAPSRFEMGERARVSSFVRIVGKEGQVRLGAQSFVGLGCLIDMTSGFELGERSELGPRGIYYTHGAPGLLFNVSFPQTFAPIRIGRDSWVSMGCVVNPGVTVGDRSIVFPGLTLRSNVPDDTSLLPREPEHRTAPTRLVTMLVKRQHRLEKVEVAFGRLAAQHARSIVDRSRESIWSLELPGRRTLHFLRDAEADATGLTLLRERSAVWTLSKVDGIHDVPQFCFDELRVHGPWTSFAEQLAAALDRNDGARFVFAARPDPD